MRPCLSISRKALQSNFQVFKRKTTSPFICPMVKANAYGAGDSLVVRELLNAGALEVGVARLFEGHRLRRLFPQDRFEILVFAPVSELEIKEYLSSSLTPVLGSFSDLKAIQSLTEWELRGLKKPHLNFDLGMSRLGFDLSDVNDLKEELSKLDVDVGGICGHFSEAEDFSHEASVTSKAFKNLKDVARLFNVPNEKIHAPNTEALKHKENFDVGIRPGIGLYGVDAYENQDLKFVLRLEAPLVHQRFLKAGSKVSYGGRWEAAKDTKIGVLPIGYADGLRRGLSGKITMKHNESNQMFSQVGAICMDYTMLDIGEVIDFRPNTSFTLFEKSEQLQEWSRLLDTIPYEILTGLGDRVQRQVVA